MSESRMDASTDARKQALALYSGPHRTYGVFLMIAEGPMTLQEITTAVPPGDPDWTEAIIQDLLVRRAKPARCCE
jgi:hypothetical protein